jgi:DNA-binding Lrp family transcriptional regulator
MQRKAMVDKLDLKIISLLSENSRISYRNISSIVDLTPNAVKIRVNKMISNGIIKEFVVRVNPSLLGYEKEISLTIRNINRKIKDENIINKLNLFGEILVFAKQLGGSCICILAAKEGTEEKIRIINDLMKPAIVEKTILANYSVPSMKIHISDLKIIKCLLSNPRMQIENISKETSLSTKTVARWFEKMKKNRIVQFTIMRDMSSLQLIGYIEFALIINVNEHLYRSVLETIYQEMAEYILFIPNIYRNNIIFAVLFCANIPMLDLIVTRLQTYKGVEKIELFITTKLAFYQDWLKKEIEKRLQQSIY